MAARTASGISPRQFSLCGAILTAGYIGLFCLMQAPAFWYDLRPDPARSLIAEVFGPVNSLFPQRWVNLERTDTVALVAVPIYLSVVILITGPLLYLLRKMSRPGAIAEADRRPALRRVFGWTAVIMLVLLFQRGLLSSDIYNYAWYSRIWVDHDASPYTHAPAEFPPDPEGSIYWIGWPEETAVYGPAWLMVSSVTHRLSRLIGGSFSAQILTLRLLADAAHLLNAWLVWGIMGLILARRRPHQAWPGHQRRRPGQVRTAKITRPYHLRRPMKQLYRRTQQETMQPQTSHAARFAALLVYLWNPLALVEFAGSGHNDVVMITFILLALWLHLKGKWPLAAIALALATLVKLPALLLLPAYLWLLMWSRETPSRAYLARQKLRAGVWRAAQTSGIIILTWVVLYLPFWEGPRTLGAVITGPANRLYMHTLASDARTNLPQIAANIQGISENRDQYIEAISQFLDANLRLWLMGLLGIVALAVTWRARTFDGMLAAWGWVMIAAMVTQGWFWPWYVTWAIVPAALSQNRRLLTTTLIFSVSSLLLYLEEQVLGPHFTLFLDWSGLFVMGPPLAYLAISALTESKRQEML